MRQLDDQVAIGRTTRLAPTTNITPGMLGAALLTVVFWACGAPASPAASPTEGGAGAAAQALIEQRCASCHDLERVNQPRPADQWPTIIDDMIDNGAELNDAERQTVIDHLSSR